MIKHPIKWHIYWTATTIRDYGVPGVTYLADKVRDWAWNEDMWQNY